MQTPRTHSHALSRPSTRLAIVSLLVVAAAALVVAMQSSAAPAGTQIKTAMTPLGRVLVDTHGKTLYLFVADKNGKSVCSGECAAFWPPLMTTAKGLAGAGVKSSLLGTTKRSGGKLQVTYKGHPLYLFKLDAKAGQTKGEGMNGFGGLWWAVSPAGAAVKHAATSSTPAPTTPTNPGYGSYGP